MKKFSILIICFIFLYSCNFALALNEKNKYIAGYKKSDTISLDKYLHRTRENSDSLQLNKNGDVIYNGKVIINEKGKPINDNSYSYLEIKIYLVASGAVPKEGCDETDTINNGIYGLGCYIDNPDE